ncbi:MAG TPA: ClpXP protease specificity-enhancing factor SspB [Rhizomicrobium sp.]
MAKDYIGYQALTDAALRGVVRDALRRIEKQGLIGSHHFYLTFKTHFPGVEIPGFLREQYPEEMTIILQHQFWGLKVKDEQFEVALTFRKLPATLVIPFAALTAFFDPGVQFGLQFKGMEGEAKAGGPAQVSPPQPAAEQNHTEPEEPAPAVEAPEKPAAPAEVVSLDSFRKK